MPPGPAPAKAGGFHDAVIARAVDQRVGLHVEHRIFRDLGHAGTDAAIVQDHDLAREVVADERLHLHAREADRRVAGEVDDRPVRVHHAGGDGLAEAGAYRAVAASVEPQARLSAVGVRWPEQVTRREAETHLPTSALLRPANDHGTRRAVADARAQVAD